MTHICVRKLTIIGSDNGLSPERHQANIWTNAGILLIGALGTNFSENVSEINTFSFKKMHLKTSSAKRRPFCLGLNVLIQSNQSTVFVTEYIHARLHPHYDMHGWTIRCHRHNHMWLLCIYIPFSCICCPLLLLCCVQMSEETTIKQTYFQIPWLHGNVDFYNTHLVQSCLY